MSSPINVMVVGTGAVGALFASRIGQASRTRVTTVCRSNYNAVLNDGIQLDTRIWGPSTFRPHTVVQSPAQGSRLMKYDYVVMATKALSNTRHYVSKLLGPAVTRDTTLVSLHNGVDVDKPLLEAFPENPVLSAICYVNCIQHRPGGFSQVSKIRPQAFHVGHDASRTSSSYQISEHSLQRLLSLSTDSAFLHYAPDINYTRWEKICFNAAWNSVCTIFDMNTKEVLQTPSAVALVKLLANEARAVARARGVDLPLDISERTLKVAETAECITPSMLQDRREGRSLEIDALCGDVAKLGESYGVPVPTLKMICNALREIQQGGNAAFQDSFSLDRTAFPEGLLTPPWGETGAPVLEARV